MIDYTALDEQQRSAIMLCSTFNAQHKIVCVSGSPGTGKTTILQHAHRTATDLGHDALLCAPTGKAARRISEATGIAAVTIHAALEFPKPGEKDEKTGKALFQPMPRRNAKNPLEYNVVYVDEASMLNTELAGQLLEAMPRGGYLRLFGDHNQLPPIEKFTPKDYIPPFRKFWEKQGVHLTQVYRQAEGSGILLNADRINHGYMPLPKDDFILTQCFSQRDYIANIARRDDTLLFAGLSCQIITPQNKGIVGTHALNAMLQLIYNPKPEKQTILERNQYHPQHETGLVVGTGDKIIMTANWYLIEPFGIMNGEIGTVLDIGIDGTIIADFGYDLPTNIPPVVIGVDRKGREVQLNPQMDIELAYAITTHKSQGSEYDRVIYVMDRSHMYLLCRANFYTAITRARKHVNVVYKAGCMQPALAKTSLSAKEKRS